MENKKISVIMPIHNCDTYLRQAIDSILQQTFTNFEFIIVDDASNENTKKIIKSYTDERIVLLENKEKLGVAKSLNKAIAIAQGDYIARMDADDISLVNRFDKQISYLEKKPLIDLVGSNAYLINANDKEIGLYIRPSLPKIIKWTAFFSNPMIHPSIMAKAPILKQNHYQENLENGQDYELWSRLIFTNHAQLANLDDFLLKHRVHQESVTQKAIIQNKKGGSLKISTNNLNYFGLDAPEKNNYLQVLFDQNVTIKKYLSLIKSIKKLEKKFIINEQLNPQEIQAIKDNNRKRYFGLIKQYGKNKLKKLLRLTLNTKS